MRHGLILNYILLLFLDFNPDPDIKIKAGWGFILVFSALIAINSFYLIIDLGHFLYTRITYFIRFLNFKL